MKALFSAFALLAFVAATTLPYAAQAQTTPQTQQTTPQTQKTMPKKAPVKKKAKKHASAKKTKKKTPAAPQKG